MLGLSLQKNMLSSKFDTFNDFCLGLLFIFSDKNIFGKNVLLMQVKS